MSHTLTFDTSTAGYNHDVDLNILASPFDANGGLHEAEVTFTEGTYRYFCAIPGHGEMWGELVVTGDGGGGDDTTAPSVTATVTGDQDGDGAYVGGATVTLDAVDDGSGVAGVEYNLDGAGWTAYTEPFSVDAVGEHSLEFRATDEAGNTSEAQTATFTVVEGDVVEDTTAPTVSAMLMGDMNDHGQYVGSAQVMLHAEDEEGGSGVDSIEYQVDGQWMPYTAPVDFTEPGEHTVSYRATDAAGNQSQVRSTTFTVIEGDEPDTTAPTVTAEVSGTEDENGAFVGSATATLTATDDASGVETVEYDLDGAGWAEYTEPVVVTEPGEHTLVYRATDAEGNVSEETVTTFTVVAEDNGDTTAPTVATELSGTQDENGAYVGSASVMVTATDDAPASHPSSTTSTVRAGPSTPRPSSSTSPASTPSRTARRTRPATSPRPAPSRSTSSSPTGATPSPRRSATASWARATRPASTSAPRSSASSRPTPTPVSRPSSTRSTAASGCRTPRPSRCATRASTP
nr:Ig-like domain repeat protein [Cellulosimicrobium sp. CUA-896]